MKFWNLLRKAYKEAKVQEDKQKRYEAWQKMSFTCGMAEELARTVKVTGVSMKVKLADNSEITFEPSEDPLVKRRSQYVEGF